MRARRRVCRQRRFGLRVDMFDVTAGKGRKVARLDQQRCRAASARRLDNQRAGRARRDAARLDDGPVDQQRRAFRQPVDRYRVATIAKQDGAAGGQTGGASSRERGWQYGWIWVDASSSKKKTIRTE